MKFPKVIATEAPKPLSKKAAIIGKVAAGILAFFAIVQILGVSNMIDNLSAQFYGGEQWAVFVVMAALISEVFAIPFLVRMKLSEGARLISGTMAMVAPWIWVMVLVWSVGENASAAQFGVLDSFNISWWVLAFNVAWLVFNFYAIWQLGLEKTWRIIIDESLKLKKTKK